MRRMREKPAGRSGTVAAGGEFPLAGGHVCIDLASVKEAYRRFVVVYDAIFGWVLQRGRVSAIRSANPSAGQRILEIGVGTGLCLDLYRRDARVVGIDVSPEMLNKARTRVEKLGLHHVDGLLDMDAGEMVFPDHSFDAVVACYVVTVLPNLAKAAAELRRVCAPGGRIVVVSRFSSEKALGRTIEGLFVCVLRRLGLASHIRLQQLIDAIGLSPVAVKRVNILGFWKLVVFRNA